MTETIEWQPIETAPKDGNSVDLWCKHPVFGEMRSPNMVWDTDRWETQAFGEPLNDGWVVTHWMAPPSPPARSALEEGQ